MTQPPPTTPLKFSNPFFSLEDIQEYTPTRPEGREFECVRGEFKTYLTNGFLRKLVRSSMCRSWVVRNKEGLAGYITLSADKLTTEEDEVRLLEKEGIRFTAYPAVKIGLLAVDQRAGGKGVGTLLLEWAAEYVVTKLWPLVGVRFLTVDAFYDRDPDAEGKRYDASGFYTKAGFEFLRPNESLPPERGYRSMYLDLKELISAIHPDPFLGANY